MQKLVDEVELKTKLILPSKNVTMCTCSYNRTPLPILAKGTRFSCLTPLLTVHAVVGVIMRITRLHHIIERPVGRRYIGKDAEGTHIGENLRLIGNTVHNTIGHRNDLAAADGIVRAECAIGIAEDPAMVGCVGNLSRLTGADAVQVGKCA